MAKKKTRKATDNGIAYEQTRTLSLDPGPVNYGWSVTRLRGKEIEVVACGNIPQYALVQQVGAPDRRHELGNPFRNHRRYLARLIRRYRVDRVAIERYVPRTKGISNETVNQLIGICASYCAEKRILITFFLSATWKVWLKKQIDLDAQYKLVRVVDHQVDATYIGLYDWWKTGRYKPGRVAVANTKQPKAPVVTPKISRQIVEQINAKTKDPKPPSKRELAARAKAAAAKKLDVRSRRSKRRKV